MRESTTLGLLRKELEYGCNTATVAVADRDRTMLWEVCDQDQQQWCKTQVSRQQAAGRRRGSGSDAKEPTSSGRTTLTSGRDDAGYGMIGCLQKER